ncbi:MAG: UDP-N-acetylmuramoyl-tripeptide--D-alanyl-D-alanine ligase [Bacteroidales bacterium]|jgi:UDP-N-acetylmuramoyl-tripeptide--D-alanyl-D-alanine ligase
MEFNRKDNKQKVKELYSIFCKHPNITTDSRNIKKGDIFFALKGENFNGNKFAEKAIEQGAVLAVIDEKEYNTNNKCFLVDDVLHTLQLLANHHRRQFPDLKMLSITGTNGKTTTKELCYAVLSKRYNTIATQGNLNNHIGVPLTLLRITKDTEFAIIEMGANHIGEIDFLCHIAEPVYGLITNIGRAHLEGFGGFEGVVKTKTEMFRYLDRPNHYCIINMDDKSLGNYSHSHKNIVYHYSLEKNIESKTATLYHKGKVITSNLVGSYNAYNMLAAITVGEIFDVPSSLAIEAIENYKPQNHRSQIAKTDKNTLILDCYNANPSSVNAVLNAFESLNAEKKYVFIGAMKELGESSREEHKKVLEILKKMNLEQIVLVGDEFKELIDDSYSWFKTSEDAKQYFIKNPITGGTILIKGSNSTKMEIIADAL